MMVSTVYKFRCDALLGPDVACRAWAEVHASNLTGARETVRHRGWTASGDRNKCQACKLARHPYQSKAATS